MKKTFSILFYPKRSDCDKNQRAPVYMRITVDGRRSEISTHRKVDPKKWNHKGGKLRGTKGEVKELNNYLDFLKSKVYDAYLELKKDGEEISSKAIKNEYLGIRNKKHLLLETFMEHNNRLKNLVGKDYSISTVKKYETTQRHIENFVHSHFKLKDILIDKVDHQFIIDFEYYLKGTKKCNHNSTVKYIKIFKKIVLLALANNWITINPFLNYKVRLKEVKREYLSSQEIQTMLDKDFRMARLNLVRDIFIFSCYTGLSYADVKKLSKNNLVKGIDGEMWIKTNRTKTHTKSNIPLLPIAIEILNKYKNHLYVKDKDILLPVLSNQKSNAYLKEIADLCGITKNLTTHLARHTFATTVTLANGVPIESVSKMLGHKSLRTTQHYAKILDRKVSNDMAELRSKLQSNPKSFSVSG